MLFYKTLSITQGTPSSPTDAVNFQVAYIFIPGSCLTTVLRWENQHLKNLCYSTSVSLSEWYIPAINVSKRVSCPCAYLIKHHAMKEYGGAYVWIHVFLTSALVWGEGSASHLCRFTPGKRAHGTHWIKGWVGPRTGPDDVKRGKILPLSGLELRLLGCLARRQSLYRLSYPGSRSPCVVMERSTVRNSWGYFVLSRVGKVLRKTEFLALN
jgi:hypothetical protein